MPRFVRSLGLVSQLPPPTHGSSIMTKVLLDTLTEGGREVRLLDKRLSGSISEVGQISVRKFFRGISLLFRAIFFARSIRHGTCIVYTANKLFPALLDACIVALLRCNKVKVVAYVHTSGYSKFARSSLLGGAAVRYSFSRCAAVVVLDDGMKAEMEELCHPHLSYVIPNTPDNVAGGRLSAKSSTVLFMSNFIPAKGLHDFVALARSLSPEFPDVRFQAAGAISDQNYYDRLALEIDELVSKGKFTWLGQLGNEKWQTLSAARLLVFPSTYPLEAQPLTIIEAMSQGAVVVAYRTGGIASLIEDGGGVVVETYDELTRQVRALLSDSDELTRRGERLAAQYALHHSRETYAASWMDLLKIVEKESISAA